MNSFGGDIMTDMRPELLDELRSLPVEERIELLVASLDEQQQADPDHAEAWIAELKRRIAEVDSGAVKLMDWAQVRARVEERLRTGR